MIHFQTLKNAKNRQNYIYARGNKYLQKQGEVVLRITSHLKKSGDLFSLLDKEKTSKSSIVAREMIIPIPNFLTADEMKKFACDYILNLKEKIPFMKDKNFLYSCAVHCKKNENGITNAHMHFLYSDRLLLDEPEVKHIKTRYYDSNGKETTKDKSSYCIKAHDEIRHFDKKILYETSNNKIHRLNDKDFLNRQDFIWREFCYQNKYLTKGQMDQIFTGLYKTKHIGPIKTGKHTENYMKKRSERIKLNEAIKYIRKNKKSLSNEEISIIKGDIKQLRVFEIRERLFNRINNIKIEKVAPQQEKIKNDIDIKPISQEEIYKNLVSGMGIKSQQVIQDKPIQPSPQQEKVKQDSKNEPISQEEIYKNLVSGMGIKSQQVINSQPKKEVQKQQQNDDDFDDDFGPSL